MANHLVVLGTATVGDRAAVALSVLIAQGIDLCPGFGAELSRRRDAVGCHELKHPPGNVEGMIGKLLNDVQASS